MVNGISLQKNYVYKQKSPWLYNMENHIVTVAFILCKKVWNELTRNDQRLWWPCAIRKRLWKKILFALSFKPIRDLCLFCKSTMMYTAVLNVVFVKNSDKLPLHIDKFAYLCLNRTKSQIYHRSYLAYRGVSACLSCPSVRVVNVKNLGKRDFKFCLKPCRYSWLNIRGYTQ